MINNFHRGFQLILLAPQKLGVPGFVTILLSLTFFGFVDDAYRGWDDTHQYLIEAKDFLHKRPLPNRDLNADLDFLGNDGPTHVPPLTPFIWSQLSRENQERSNLVRIKLFQALLMSLTFCFLAWYLGQGQFTFAGTAIVVILFFNEFTRSLIYAPISEPLSFFLLTTPYLLPQATGVLTCLQAFVRPPVLILQIANALRHWAKLWLWVSGIATLVIGIFLFKQLIIPSSINNMGIGFEKSVGIFKHLVSDSAFQFFNHLFPHDSGWFHRVWGTVILLSAAFFVYFNRTNFYLLGFCLIYQIVILMPFSGGVRYFYPMLIFIFLETRPKLSNSLIKILAFIFALHLTGQQASAILEFKRWPLPDTESQGLIQARSWLAKIHPDDRRIMMTRRRYCINYFVAKCFGPINSEQLESKLREKRIKFIVFTGAQWNSEEKLFREQVQKLFSKKQIDMQAFTSSFESTYIITTEQLLK